MADELEVPYFGTSAKDGRNIDLAFSTLLTNILQNETLEPKLKRQRDVAFKIEGRQTGGSRRSSKKRGICA